MFKLFRAFLLILFILSTTTSVYSESSWITKKSDKTKVELKKEKKEKKEKWIAKKKINIKKFKEKSKNISKEVKSWIGKKNKKDKYIKDIDKLPKAEVYFVARSDTGDLFFGYINSKKKSKKISSVDGKIKIKKNSIGFAFLNDGKTICKVSTEILWAIKKERYGGDLHGDCSNKTNFNGGFDQRKNAGNGTLYDKDGNKIYFDFYQDIKIASKTYNNFYKNVGPIRGATPIPEPPTINPTGKYYALLIGNSNYVNWASLKSPKNDVKEIEKVLNTQYDFEEVITIINGTEKEIMKGFKKLSKLTTDKDYVLIYYSGHGDNRGNSNYWIPVDGEKDYGLGDWINTAEIQNYIMDEIPNHHIVLMSDSCYFDVKTKGMQKPDERKSMAYEKLLKRRAIMISQSGSNEPVLDSSDDKHSMFGKSFINSLKSNEDIIRMTDIFEEIYLSHSGMRQQPQWGRVKAWGDAGGDFLFIAKKTIIK